VARPSVLHNLLTWGECPGPSFLREGGAFHKIPTQAKTTWVGHPPPLVLKVETQNWKLPACSQTASPNCSRRS
jgi:hypothetical protein